MAAPRGEGRSGRGGSPRRDYDPGHSVIPPILGIPEVAAALLVGGHLAGEFVVGPEARAGRPEGWGGRLHHGVVVLGFHLLFLLPLWSAGGAAIPLAAATAALLHLLVDALVDRLARRLPPARSLEITVLDQLLHMAALGAVLAGLLPRLEVASGLEPLLRDFAVVAMVAGACAFNVGGGAAVVHGVLARFSFPEDLLSRGGAGRPEEGVNGEERGKAGAGPPLGAGPGVPGSGRAIGILERLILLPLVVLGEWGGIGLILAAKSLARFRELDSRPFAEYYLIGTLTSLVVAMVTGLLLRAALGG